jgi:aldehyde dehydrogenase (NAD+)
VRTPAIQWPASSAIHPEPYGVCLIVAPWNYPFQLAVAPLIAAIAAGNCAVVKPSELAPLTSATLDRILRQAFNPSHVAVVEGDSSVSRALLDEPFDKIFFTGSTRVGKIVMKAAARHLTPVTLELGGKSPCIVADDAHLPLAARRIAWGKFINAGQTCVAPDYLLVQENVKDELLAGIEASIRTFYGENPAKSADYARIINRGHFDRLVALLKTGPIRTGGNTDAQDRYIAPTVLDPVCWNDPIMGEEIFGPLLPVISFSSLNEAVEAVKTRPAPLALYFFGNSKAAREKVIGGISFGGGCVNDTLVHLGSPHLPFGGVGQSGMGSYHGKAGFDAFSHRKSVLKRGAFPDAPVRYPPFSQWKTWLAKRLLR